MSTATMIRLKHHIMCIDFLVEYIQCKVGNKSVSRKNPTSVCSFECIQYRTDAMHSAYKIQMILKPTFLTTSRLYIIFVFLKFPTKKSVNLPKLQTNFFQFWIWSYPLNDPWLEHLKFKFALIKNTLDIMFTNSFILLLLFCFVWFYSIFFKLE